MSPQQAAVIIPISVLCIWFASYYLNIRSAKKRVLDWRRSTTFMFLRSNGLGGIRTRARSVWMDELGYNEREAIILAECQFRANLFAFLGMVVFCTIAVNFVRP